MSDTFVRTTERGGCHRCDWLGPERETYDEALEDCREHRRQGCEAVSIQEDTLTAGREDE